MLRIATFNLENLDDGPSVVPPLEERIAVLRPQLESLHADILCLQEINGQKRSRTEPRDLHALDKLLKGTAYADFYRAFTERDDGKGAVDKHNLVVLSRYPIESYWSVHHERVDPPLVKLGQALPREKAPAPVYWDRPILQTVIVLETGERLHLLNLHLRAPLAASVPGQKKSPFAWKSTSGWAEGYYLAAVKRSGQALEARLLVDEIFDSDPAALIAVCGDINADAYEVPSRILKADLDDTDNPGLAGRVLFEVDERLPDGERYSVIHHNRRQMLDHILVSKALATRCRSVEVVNREVRDEYADHLVDAHPPQSHHAPVVALFEDKQI